MAIPSGTNYYIIISVNKDLIGGVLSNFPYQIDLSAKIASDSTFKSYISTSSNIAVYDPVGDSVRPKKTYLNLANNKLLITFDGSTSTTANKIYYVCVGTSLSNADSATALSNSNFSHYWAMNEFVNGSTTVDDVGSFNLSVGGTATIGNVGKFGNCAVIPSTGSAVLTATNQVIGTANCTIELLLYFNSFGTSGRVIDNGRTLFIVSGSSLLYCNDNGVAPGPTYVTINASNATWHHVVVVRRSTGYIDAYVDGVIVANNVYGGLTYSGSFNLRVGNRDDGIRPLPGQIDELGYSTDLKTSSYTTSRYNMFFDNTFWFVSEQSVIKVEDTWRTLTGTYINVPGGWRPVINKYVRASDGWRSVI